MKRSWLAPIGAGCLILAACEYPTEPPILEQRWVVPIEETTLSVDELLPTGVAVIGNDFSVSIDPFVTAQTLAGICAACAALNGYTVPAPAFTFSFGTSENLPADVSAAMISSASVEIRIANGFSFDPIAGGGTLRVTLSDGQGGPELGQVLVDGATEAMTPGGTLTRTIPISSASIGSTFYASVDLVSVGGQVALIDTSDQITVTATTTSLLLSSVTVSVSNQSVNLDPVELDVGDVDDELTDRIQRGGVMLAVVNPFGVSVAGTLTIGPTTKTYSIPSDATSTVIIDYTGDELRSILGQDDITLAGSGTVSGGTITVSPNDEMLVTASIDMTLLIG